MSATRAALGSDPAPYLRHNARGNALLWEELRFVAGGDAVEGVEIKDRLLLVQGRRPPRVVLERRLSDTVALVIGASSGIGAAIARRLAEHRLWPAADLIGAGPPRSCPT